jgi:NAD(P)-dependent dehydrogenase (short-subunit alcohol dehydrogenase family)
MWTKNNIPDQGGKTMIVTGANTGIGFETALALYEAGAHVVLACRSEENAEEALHKIIAPGKRGSLEKAVLDLSDLEAIQQFAEQFIQHHQRLDILINNAGVMVPPASKTRQGFELQFGVNFLGHFALTGYLYPLLQSTDSSRIVTVSSLAYLRGSIDFDNLKSENSYDATREYAQSKLANILFSVELQRRIAATGDHVLSIAAQPGANKTALARHMDEKEFQTAAARVGALMEPWQGALPSLFAAVSPEAKGGRLYSPDQDGGYRGFPAELQIIPGGLDEPAANKLWKWAEDIIGFPYPGHHQVVA